MITLSERTRVPAEPADAWRLFEEMERHYVDWHPEHLSWRWLCGEPLAVGAARAGRFDSSRRPGDGAT